MRSIEFRNKGAVTTPSVQQVHKAALFARRNAERLLRDAKLLLKAKSVAHAYGMLVFAEEEYGKAIVFHLYADGYLKNQEWLWLVTRKHEAKHAALAITIFTRLLLFLFFGLDPMERARTNKRTLMKTHRSLEPVAIIHQRLQDALEDLPSAVNTVADVLDELKQLGRMQEEREQCFYVDFQLDGRPTNPLSMNSAVGLRHMRRALVRLDACRTFLGSPKIALKNRQRQVKVPEVFRVQISAFESYIFGKKGVNNILGWLKGPEPRNISEGIRNSTNDEVLMTQIRNKIAELLNEHGMS